MQLVFVCLECFAQRVWLGVGLFEDVRGCVRGRLQVCLRAGVRTMRCILCGGADCSVSVCGCANNAVHFVCGMQIASVRVRVHDLVDGDLEMDDELVRRQLIQ